MNRLTCDVYHSTDGACCHDIEPCLSAAERSPLLHPTHVVVMTEILWLVVGLGCFALVLLVAFVQLERQQRIDDIANQEMRPSVVIGTAATKDDIK